MNNYFIILQYDASSYNGWQSQKNTSNTIQETIENTISDFLNEHIELCASGRTDAGVHAHNQTANFHSKQDINMNAFISTINSNLPDDIKVNSIEKVDSNFHARLSAKSKTYCYTIISNDNNDVFKRKYSYYTNKELDIEAMKKASKMLIGEHDFKSFTNSKKYNLSTIRSINSIKIMIKDNSIKFYVNGNGFLYNMVRIIVGTLFLVGTHEIAPDDISFILQNKDRKKAGPMLPAYGLCLWEVFY